MEILIVSCLEWISAGIVPHPGFLFIWVITGFCLFLVPSDLSVLPHWHSHFQYEILFPEFR
jgi:hypothetical protein